MIFRKINRLLLLLLLAAVIAPFFITGKDGRPLLSLEKIKQSAASFTDRLPTFDKKTPTIQTTVFRWRNADGTWQYSNQPPPTGIRYEIVVVDPDTNLIPAIDNPSGEPSPSPPAHPDTEDETPLPFSSKKIQELMKRARSVQDAVDERKAAQDRQIDAAR